jgi:hypothetical protein
MATTRLGHFEYVKQFTGVTGSRDLLTGALIEPVKEEAPLCNLVALRLVSGAGGSGTDGSHTTFGIPGWWDIRNHTIEAYPVWLHTANTVGDRDVLFDIEYEFLSLPSRTFLNANRVHCENRAVEVPTAAPAADAMLAVSSEASIIPRQGSSFEYSWPDDDTIFMSVGCVMSAFDASFTEAKYLYGLWFKIVPRFHIPVKITGTRRS